VCAISDKVYAIKEGRIVTELEGDKIKANVCEGYL
jgi:ABC-type branched-subunit amino acid transport system ATPase component